MLPRFPSKIKQMSERGEKKYVLTYKVGNNQKNIKNINITYYLVVSEINIIISFNIGEVRTNLY